MDHDFDDLYRRTTEILEQMSGITTNEVLVEKIEDLDKKLVTVTSKVENIDAWRNRCETGREVMVVFLRWILKFMGVAGTAALAWVALGEKIREWWVR